MKKVKQQGLQKFQQTAIPKANLKQVKGGSGEGVEIIIVDDIIDA